MKKKNVSSRNSLYRALLHVTSDVHLKAGVEKKEDELSFSVDIEVNNDCMQILLFF